MTSAAQAPAAPRARVSMVIPTLNAAHELPGLLYRLARQTRRPDEVVVVDSSSDDDTVRVARDYGAVAAVIERSAFNHGLTRHGALLGCAGEVVCFMTQDAVPADDRYLENLLAPLDDPRVGCSSGRQLPKPGARRFEQLVREFNYGPEPELRGAGDVQRLGLKAFFATDVCSAYRRSAYLECGGFPETDMSEDMYMAARMIAAGYKVAYAADARVYHSHDLTPSQQFRRNEAVGRFLARYGADLMGAGELGEGARLAAGVAGRLLCERDFPELVAFGADCAARLAGNRAGRARAAREAAGGAL